MHQENTAAWEALLLSEYGNTAGLWVQKGDETVCEWYPPGVTPDMAIQAFSVTKSILSLLVGIAIDRGLIRGVEQKVLDFFPAYTVKRGEKTIQQITLRHLLTMTAPYKYQSPPYTRYFSSESWVTTALDLLGGRGEVGAFRYTPLIGPDILSGVLANATGQSVLAFAQQNLFAPLGIDVKQNIVFHSKEEQLSIMKNHRSPGWVADPQGINTAGWGLFVTLADLAKIGRLCLQRGSWNGRQVVSDAWIAQSTAVHSRWNTLAYGYLWWIVDEQEACFAALGDGGNVIYVNPHKEVVVAMTAFFQPRARDRIALIREQIEPRL